MSGEFERWVKQNRKTLVHCRKLIDSRKVIVEPEDYPDCEDCFAATHPNDLTECPTCGSLVCGLCLDNFHGSEICDEKDLADTVDPD